MTPTDVPARSSSVPRVVMTSSAAVFGALGLVATFAPDAISAALGARSLSLVDVVLQLLGAAYVGLAVMSWMSRHNLIGGIYGRPLVLCQLLHTLSGALALAKGLASAEAPAWAWGVCGAYAALAVCFGMLLTRHPLAPPQP